jgi:hypothetical protein
MKTLGDNEVGPEVIVRAWYSRVVRRRSVQFVVVWCVLLFATSIFVTTFHVGSANDPELGRVPNESESVAILLAFP